MAQTLEPLVHPTAVVSPDARLGVDVRIGPFAVVGDQVRIGDRTRVGSHVVIEGPTTIGEDNVIFPFAALGHPPQDLKYAGEPTELVVGDRNQIREYVTLHRGTAGGGGVTRVGSDNLIMISTHVAHDCRIGDRCILANAATLAGHVTVEDGATVGALTAIHQFCRIGRHSFIGGESVIVKDVLPFSRCQGNHARCFGENAVGLRRKGFSDDEVRRVHRAFRLLLAAKLNTTQAVEAIRADEALMADPNVAYLVTFIESSERGVIKK
jgi:UDP-N-acetylglucosamine acyltransferase